MHLEFAACWPPPLVPLWQMGFSGNVPLHAPCFRNWGRWKLGGKQASLSLSKRKIHKFPLRQLLRMCFCDHCYLMSYVGCLEVGCDWGCLGALSPNIMQRQALKRKREGTGLRDTLPQICFVGSKVPPKSNVRGLNCLTNRVFFLICFPSVFFCELASLVLIPKSENSTEPAWSSTSLVSWASSREGMKLPSKHLAVLSCAGAFAPKGRWLTPEVGPDQKEGAGKRKQWWERMPKCLKYSCCIYPVV